MIKNFKKTTGFTLVEIMVATSIFMIIMLVALGALISSSDTAKKSQALRTAMDNVNFAMESMTKSLRMGTDYYCVLSSSSVSLPVSIGTYSDCPRSGKKEKHRSLQYRTSPILSGLLPDVKQ
jgi:type II secretory pathway pseudopilin PulG